MQRLQSGLGDGAALIVIDVQNDFVTGSMAVPDAERIIDPINRLAAAFETVVVVQDWHPPYHVSFASAHPGTRHRDVVQVAHGAQRVFHDHCVQGTSGAELDPRLRLTKAALVFRKGYRRDVDSHSAFFENNRRTATGLSAYLRARSIERLYCVGLTRYGCVMMSAEDAARDGFQVTIVDDACEDNDLDGLAIEAADRALADLGVGRIDSDALLW
jgi:nicotinamidase/pyrazinamidase